MCVCVFKLQAQSHFQNTFLWPVKVSAHPEVNLALFLRGVFSPSHSLKAGFVRAVIAGFREFLIAL